MKYQNILSRTENGITTITINRPSKLNALNRETIQELHEAFEEADNSAEAKVIIVTGSGEKAFVAGADIDEIAELNELNARKFSEIGQETFNIIETCHKPVIAVVNGYALGGGCELAMMADFIIAAERWPRRHRGELHSIFYDPEKLLVAPCIHRFGKIRRSRR